MFKACVIDTMRFLLSAFDFGQSHLTQLKFVLNAGRSNNVLFWNGKYLPCDLSLIFTADGTETERVVLLQNEGTPICERKSKRPKTDTNARW